MNCCRWTCDRPDGSERLRPAPGSAGAPGHAGLSARFQRWPRSSGPPERRRSGAARPGLRGERGSASAPCCPPGPSAPAAPPRAGAGPPPPPGAGCCHTHRSATPCFPLPCRDLLCRAVLPRAVPGCAVPCSHSAAGAAAPAAPFESANRRRGRGRARRTWPGAAEPPRSRDSGCGLGHGPRARTPPPSWNTGPGLGHGPPAAPGAGSRRAPGSRRSARRARHSAAPVAGSGARHEESPPPCLQHPHLRARHPDTLTCPRGAADVIFESY